MDCGTGGPFQAHLYDKKPMVARVNRKTIPFRVFQTCWNFIQVSVYKRLPHLSQAAFNTKRNTVNATSATGLFFFSHQLRQGLPEFLLSIG